MPIFTKVDNQVREIKNAIVKIGGQVISTCPLRAKIDGMIVDFIVYMDGNSLIQISPEGFSSSALNKILDSLEGNLDTLIVHFQPGDFHFTSTVAVGENTSILGSGNSVFYCTEPLTTGLLWVKCANNVISDVTFEFRGFRNANAVAVHASPQDFFSASEFTKIKNCSFKEFGLPIKIEESYNVTIDGCSITNGSRPDMCELLCRRSNYIYIINCLLSNLKVSVISSVEVTIGSNIFDLGEVSIDKEQNGGYVSRDIKINCNTLKTVDVSCNHANYVSITGNKIKSGSTLSLMSGEGISVSSNIFSELASATPPIVLVDIRYAKISGNIADLGGAHTFCFIDGDTNNVKLISNNVNEGTLMDNMAGTTNVGFFNVV